jgi:transposase-like protein
MTSRTKHYSVGQNQRQETHALPSALQRRRQEALERYLAGDPIAVICHEMGCAKSWLYTWKQRYQVTEPAWFQEHSRRPETTPTKTPAALEAEIVRLRRALSPDGSGPVSADVICDHLRQHGGDSLPSRRTIYRILNRQAKEVDSHQKTGKKIYKRA